MKANMFVIASIALTAFSWGIYGPVLHWGQEAMGRGRLRPFMCVGIAYFAWAVVLPLILLAVQKWESESIYQWTVKGAFWSLAAGSAGALGAIGIILAFKNGGSPTYVMPLVFGCAPVVNALLVISVYNLWNKIDPFFAAGLILVAVGAVTVLLRAPKPTPPGGKTAAAAVTRPAEKPAADGVEDHPANAE